MIRIILLMLLTFLCTTQVVPKAVVIKQKNQLDQGWPHRPIATTVAADYDMGILTVTVTHYYGNAILQVANENNVLKEAQAFINGDGTITIDLTTIPNGQYTLYVTLGDEVYVGTFTKN